jgi:hypothetical protein
LSQLEQEEDVMIDLIFAVGVCYLIYAWAFTVGKKTGSKKAFGAGRYGRR